MTQASDFLRDRIQVNALLIVVSFMSVLLLNSQSAASYPTYLLALSMLVFIRQWDDVFRLRIIWVILGLLVYLALSSLWSEPLRWREVTSSLTRSLLVGLFVVAFAECQLRGQLRRWLGRGLAAVGALATGAAILVYMIEPPPDGRLNGLGQLDTQVIAALVYGTVLLFVLQVIHTDRSSAWRVVASISAAIIVVAVFLSDSRNAWVSVLIGAGVLLAAHRILDRQRFVAAVAAFAVVLGVALAALAAVEESRQLVLPRGDSFRPAIWQAAIDRLLEHGLWFGAGIGTSDDFELAGLTFQHPHNMYLSVLFQGGLIALCAFLAIIVWSVRTLILHYERSDAKLALGILGIALPAYLLDGHELVDKVGATWFLFWLPVAISVGFGWAQPRKQ